MGFSRRRPGITIISRVLTELEASERRLTLADKSLASGSVLILVGNGGGHQVQNVDYYLDQNSVRWGARSRG